MRFNTFIFLPLCCVANSFIAQDSLSTRPKKKWFSLHAQETTVGQYKPAIRAPYSGTNSLIGGEEWVNTLTSTLYTAVKLWPYSNIVFNPEIAGGAGLSQALGIAAASNGESFRVGNPAPTIYIARAYIRQLFPLSKERERQPDDENRVEQQVPVKYISLTVGKISIADYFDDNSFAHNPRTQFLSWGLMSNGAWDYPANTRGYTPSVMLEWITPKIEFRYAASMMPTTANGNVMDGNLDKANAQTIEFKYKFSIHGRAGKISALGFMNTAHMGSYTAPNILPVETDHGTVNTYAIRASEQYGRTKYGFGINLEQYITDDLGFFARASYNDGKTETWCFTEIDQAFSAGLSLKGTKWKRKNDVFGLAYSLAGISDEHASYLASGGYGFIIGDGQLNYGTENLFETYYSCSLMNDRIIPSIAYQFVINPAYNKDRGPASIISLRLHFRI
ncbi:MAG: carbohydrate porin [Bacteroidia bacterium]